MTLFPLEPFTENPALIDGDQGQIVTYGELKHFSTKLQLLIREERALVFLFSRNRMEEVIAYIGVLNSGHAVCILDAHMSDLFKTQLIKLYCPNFIFGAPPPSHSPQQAPSWENYEQVDSPWDSLPIYRALDGDLTLHPQLQLLLTTSGTTGNPKLIRLSKDNLLSNARAIIHYLDITAAERAIASLPFHYSYGLSVLHTHLLAGASVVLTQSSVAQDPFWNIIQSYRCTSLAGVPYTYKIMDRIGFEKLTLPSLRMLTQAGGRLESSLILKYHQIMGSRGGAFVVMYGQTEATARIAYLPLKYLPKKAGAIGIAIPNGMLQVFDEDQEITASKQIGELIYRGPNVMMGYAATPSDLMKGDEMGGILRTGDLGYFDEDGIFFLTGRLKRISKVYGLRISLDDIERELSVYGMIAVTTTDTHLCIYIENGVPDACEKCMRHLADLYQLHPSTFRCSSILQLPRTSAGKIDYQQL